MATYIWYGGTGSWTDPLWHAPENSQGQFIYYSGAPGPGDVVVLQNEPTLSGVNIVGQTWEINGSVQDTIENSSIDSSTTINVIEGGGGGWSNTDFGTLTTAATMNLGNGAGFARVAFLLAGSIDSTSTIVNTGVINIDDTEFNLAEARPGGNPLDCQFINENTVNVDNGSTLFDMLSGGTDGFVNDGTIAINGGGAASSLADQAYFSGALIGIGAIDITDGELVVQSVSLGQTIDFQDSHGMMVLGAGDITGGAFQGTIEGFRPGDTIDLGTAASNIDPSELGEIIINQGVNTIGSIDITAAPGNNTWALVTSVVNGDGLLEMHTGAAACYAAGTRIRTSAGEVAVEQLRVGDDVLAHEGDGRMAPSPIVWVGHRAVDCRRHPAPRSVWPVRIAAGAFGPGQPTRDLFLSPDHAVFVDGALIPIRCLINGATVAQTPVPRVIYFHVELARHAVLLAEGLPAESFLDTGNRAAFDNGGAAVYLHPDFSQRLWDADACAPLVLAGPRVAAAQRRLRARAAKLGHALAAEPNLRVPAARSA